MLNLITPKKSEVSTEILNIVKEEQEHVFRKMMHQFIIPPEKSSSRIENINLIPVTSKITRFYLNNSATIPFSPINQKKIKYDTARVTLDHMYSIVNPLFWSNDNKLNREQESIKELTRQYSLLWYGEKDYVLQILDELGYNFPGLELFKLETNCLPRLTRLKERKGEWLNPFLNSMEKYLGENKI